MTDPAPEPNDERISIRTLMAITVVVSLVAIGGIYALATNGETWVVGMEDRVGETVAFRAVQMSEAGLYAEAVQEYAKILDAAFDDPRQIVWTGEQMIAPMIKFEEYDQAANVAMILEKKQSGAGNHVMRIAEAAMFTAGAHEAAIAALESWAEFAEDRGEAGNAAEAHYRRARNLAALDRNEDARGAAKASLVDPAESWVPVSAAELLLDLGYRDDATAALNTIQNPDAEAQKRIEALRAQLEQK